MDMSFAIRRLLRIHVKTTRTLEKVYTVPVDLDKRVARLKLESMGVKNRQAHSEQEEYLASWSKARKATS